MDDLICEIRSLLELGYEGGYWDFKSDYPDKNKKEDKLHDIICMANNLEDRWSDLYLRWLSMGKNISKLPDI